jgi:predicted dehydrogenase
MAYGQLTTGFSHWDMKAKKDSKLAVAVLGGGFGSWFHLPGLLAQPERFTVKRFCDQNAEVVKGVLQDARLAGAVGGTDYKEVLSDPAVDAVIVSLPHHLHEPVCVAAVQSGKHMMVDKPIARTLAEADRIIEAAERNNVTLMVAHNQRFEPPFLRIQETLTAGGLGRALYAVTSHNQNFNRPRGTYWRSKESVGGGCLIGSGVHNLDLMRWFFGEADEVFAYEVLDPDRLEAEVAVSASLRFKSGVIVNFNCNWGLHGDHHGDGWAVYGTEGDIALKDGAVRFARERGKSIVNLDASAKGPIGMWAHFADCIETGALPLTNGRDGKKSLGLVLKIYESIATKRPVSCQP